MQSKIFVMQNIHICVVKALVRTPDRQSLPQLRAPELKRSVSLSRPVAWIIGAPGSRDTRSQGFLFGLM